MSPKKVFFKQNEAAVAFASNYSSHGEETKKSKRRKEYGSGAQYRIGNLDFSEA